MDNIVQAHLAYNRGDLETAEKITGRCLADDEDRGDVWELRGLVEYARRRFAEAVSALERASLLVPLSPRGRVLLGSGYGKIGRKRLSSDLLREMIDDASFDPPLMLQLACGLDAVDQPGLAMKVCRRASARDPEYAQPYYDLAYYAARCGYPSNITESLARRAIALEPENVCYRIGLATLLIKLKRPTEAYDFVSHLNEEQIERIHCRCCLERVVELFESAGDFQRAMQCRARLFELAIKNGDPECE